MDTDGSNSKSRILILDDRPINRQFLTTLLTYRGFDTREAGDGLEGLKTIQDWRPDLAIVDIQMPNMSGVEFVRHLRGAPDLANLPIIFYTASYEASEARRLAKECGVRYLLMKPSEPELILETVDKALGRLAVRGRSAIAEAAATEFVRLHSEALRTTALIDFQLEIATRRQPDDVLKFLARAARTVIPSAHGTVTLMDGEGIVEISDEHDSSGDAHRRCGSHLLAGKNEARTARGEDFLGVAIETANKRYGWLCLTERLTGKYSLEDERLALTLTAEAAISYENLLLYQELRKDAGVLDRNVSLLRSTIEASNDGILVVDRDSKFVVFNRRFVDMWSMPEEVLRAGGRGGIDHAGTLVKDRVRFEAMIERGYEEPEEELFGAHELKDGRIIESVGAPHRLEGNVIGRVWNFRDVTASRRAEADVRGALRDRELLLESTGEGIYALDGTGRCTMANRVASTMLGYTTAELIGRELHPLIHHHKADGSPYPNEECAITRAFQAGKPARVMDEVYWRKDGTSFPVEYLSSPLIDYTGVLGVVVTFSDVTERRRLERRLEQVSRISSLGRMASTIAHEFNNVLMGIQPFAELIRRRATEDVKIEQAALQILNSVNRGKSVTQDILRMTRTPEPTPQSVDVTRWLGELTTEMRAMLGAVEVVVKVPPPGTLFARFDPNQMQQVIANLAINARDAMAGRGTLTMSAAIMEHAIRLSVADAGCGIADETLPFIFEPLFTTKHSGTGLGLAVAQQLVVRNGGTITVESSVGKGTTFHLDLPKSLPAVWVFPDEEHFAPRDFGVRRVLIVEDDVAVASGLSSALEIEDVQVLVVDHGREAVNAVASFEPDVVLIDLSLPDISGMEVYEQISARWPEMSVIFSTGHGDEAMMPNQSSKRVGFLRKPYSTEALLAKLREVVSVG